MKTATKMLESGLEWWNRRRNIELHELVRRFFCVFFSYVFILNFQYFSIILYLISYFFPIFVLFLLKTCFSMYKSFNFHTFFIEKSSRQKLSNSIWRTHTRGTQQIIRAFGGGIATQRTGTHKWQEVQLSKKYTHVEQDDRLTV